MFENDQRGFRHDFLGKPGRCSYVKKHIGVIKEVGFMTQNQTRLVFLIEALIELLGVRWFHSGWG